MSLDKTISKVASLSLLRGFGLLYPEAFTVASLDADDQPLVYVNQHFEALSGYASSEIIGRNCRFLQGEDQKIEELALLRQAIVERKHACIELDNTRKSGEAFVNRLLLIPVTSEDGNFAIGLQNKVVSRERKERNIDIQHLTAPIENFKHALGQINELSRADHTDSAEEAILAQACAHLHTLAIQVKEL